MNHAALNLAFLAVALLAAAWITRDLWMYRYSVLYPQSRARFSNRKDAIEHAFAVVKIGYSNITVLDTWRTGNCAVFMQANKVGYVHTQGVFNTQHDELNKRLHQALSR